MPPMNYRVTTRRGGNLVVTNAQQIGSPRDARWATGRNVKQSLPGRRWQPVEVWTLKRRGADGKVEIVARGRGRVDAEHFVRTGEVV